MKPFVTFTSWFQCKRDSSIDQILQYIIESPSMADYSPDESNGNQPHKDYARMMLDIVCIAGIMGTTNLLIEVLTAIPEEADIDLNDSKDVMLAVLEAARKRAPVNNINVIIPKEKTLVVNGKVTTLPAGTLVAGSIGLASLDPAVFPSPNVFNHRRENLVKAVMNFNAIGFDPQGYGKRQCPGRNVAMKCASEVLILHRGLVSRKK
jgi:cytochrome P450